MSSQGRRRFLKGIGSAATIGLIAGCTGGDGGDGGTTVGSTPGGLDAVTIMEPEGTLHYPFLEAALAEGIFEDEGIDLTVEYRPFGAQVQSITGGEVDTAMVSMLPYLSFYLQGEDLVTYGWNGTLQSVNALYALTDSEYQTITDLEGQRIGVWSFGSSTVQAFQAVVADETGLDLRQDFETTTAAPPALLGLIQDGEIDGVINVSGLSITMESQPDTFRRIRQLNRMWMDRTGFTLPLTSWFAYSDWYEANTEVAAGLVRGSQRAAEHWQANTASILEEYGEPAAIDTQAKIDVCERWANEGQIFLAEQNQDYIDATWEFVELMNQYEFIDEVPAQDEVIRNPL
jgi:ABC-type nitrate/sulfonate/bicarbonate transport system substrate-binding protein